MRRVFWVTVGAAGGVWAYKRGTRTVEEFRDRGLMGNLNYAAEQVRRGRIAAASVAANFTPEPKSGPSGTTAAPPQLRRDSIDLSVDALWVSPPSNGWPSSTGSTRL